MPFCCTALTSSWWLRDPSRAALGSPTPAPGKRSLSEATKAKMRSAHQAQWAKIRAAKGAPAPAKTAPKAPAKRKMSAAGRARLVAAVKARWAKVKAAGKGKL